MNKYVSSSISNHGFSRADLETFSVIADVLNQAARDIIQLSHTSGSLSSQIKSHEIKINMSPCRLYANYPPEGHAIVPFSSLIELCDEQSVKGLKLHKALKNAAENLLKAYSTYSAAENYLYRLFAKLKRNVYTASPLLAGGIATGVAATSSIIDNLAHGRGARIDPFAVLHRTQSEHEYFMDGLANKIASPRRVAQKLRLPNNSDQQTTVNYISGKLSVITSRLIHHIQGNNLQVKEIKPEGTLLTHARSIDQALLNLEKLNSGDQNIKYATVAVQQYKNSDGTANWVVTIPGTDGHLDSPFGWEQNLELMSTDDRHRMHAASARLVTEAMERAGVGSHDQVALVGYSQGGIAAAAIATDLSDRYRIEHVVTAGSPIANHPIPSKTWVTSVEMDDEIVSSLDGKKNPNRDKWLTIRGHVSNKPESVGAPVKPSAKSKSEKNELSHGMNFHRAAWENAASKGRPAQQRHGQHFAEITKGQPTKTHYYQGRMHR